MADILLKPVTLNEFGGDCLVVLFQEFIMNAILDK